MKKDQRRNKAHGGKWRIRRKLPRRRSYLSPIFGDAGAAVAAGGGRRWPGGRETKIPYFLGGGSGGRGGGNDGSSIFNATLV